MKKFVCALLCMLALTAPCALAQPFGEEMSETCNDGCLQAVLHYPTTPDETLNRALSELIQTFQDQMEELAGDCDEELIKQLLDSGVEPMSYFTLNYTESRLGERYVSYVFEASSFPMGAAHPTAQYISLSFDVQNDRRLSLSDLFQGDYLSTLREQARIALKNQMGEAAFNELDAEWFEQGLNQEGAFDTFSLSEEGLTLQFQQYQLGPYAIGSPKITIPFGELSGILQDWVTE